MSLAGMDIQLKCLGKQPPTTLNQTKGGRETIVYLDDQRRARPDLPHPVSELRFNTINVVLA